VNPALVGLRGASRGAIIGRNVRTALSAFRVRPTFVRPTLSGAWRGVKTVAGEYWKGLKYGVGHPVATARGAGGLLTGSRVFYPVPVGFKGTANQYVQQQLEASMRVPGNIQPPTSGARYKQGTPLGTVTYESGGVGTELAGGTSRPAGVIRETVMPGTQGMQIGAETRLKSGVSQVGNQYLMAATPDEALSGTTVRSGFTRFGDKFFRVVPESEAFVTRTVVQWQPGVKSGTITERVVLSPEQMSIQHANAPKTGFDVNKLWEMQSSIGQSPASTGGRRMSPAQLELLERLHMQPSSLNHPSWMKIEPVQDLSFGGGGVSTLSPTGTKVVTGGGVMTAPSTATMTPAQLQKLLGTSPITIAAGIPIGAGAIGSPVLRPYIGTDQGVSPYTLPYPGASPYTTSIPGLRPVVRPYVAPSPSTFPSTSTSPSPTTDPYPATVPVPVPVVPGTSLVPDGDTPPPPKPGVPPLLPLSLPSLSASSSPIIGGGYNKPSPLGMWVFGYNVSGVHPLTGKMVRAKGKKSMRYGAVESRILKSRNLGNNQGGSSGKIYKAVTRV